MRLLERYGNVSVMDVAERSGLRTRPRRGASGGEIFGCPCCGAHTRHPSRRDKRGAIGISGNGQGWCCHQCGASGDAVELLTWLQVGRRSRDCSTADWRTISRWLDEHAGRSGSSTQRPGPSNEIWATKYPPQHEIDAVWGSALPVDQDEGACRYLLSRNLDPSAVADRDLARALPLDGEVLTWARLGDETWPAGQYRLLFRLFDAFGRLSSLLARRIVVDPQRPKSVAPVGYQRGGLLLADGAGQQMLVDAAAPLWWSDCDVQFSTLVTEGEIDWLTCATTYPDSAMCAPAVFGIVSGSWNAEVASRFPDNCLLVVCTDRDGEGAKYREKIVASCQHRVEVRQW